MNNRNSVGAESSKASTLLNWLCATFVCFIQGLAIILAAAFAGWTLLGWLAAIKMWGTVGGGAALAMWLASIGAIVVHLVKDGVESWMDQVDQRIEVRARAWKNG